MKNLALLFMVVFFLGLFSCGSGSEDKAKNEEEQSTDNTAGEYSDADGVVTGNLPDGWKNDGTGPDSFKLYSYIMDNTGDIHKDIVTDDWVDLLDKVKEVNVDGLPALTKKEKFQQNKEMISRTWLVYNGTDIICVVVQSEKEKWDNHVASDIIARIKINKRKGNVSLPEPVEKAKFIRPELFPETIAESFNEHYANNSAILSIENIDKSAKIFLALKELGKENLNYSDDASKLVIDSVVNTNGLEDSQVFLETIKVSFVSFDLIKAFMELKKIEKDSESYKMSYDIIKSMIIQTEVNKEDILFVYNNWDTCKEFVKNIEAK
ncbi:MAG: hypothetical protein DRJ10_20055 [Bacteroidetes bacterium]|nr:MAG: hypothetical protein DRJ10_20055 [Bacteroidota bacterium]